MNSQLPTSSFLFGTNKTIDISPSSPLITDSPKKSVQCLELLYMNTTQREHSTGHTITQDKRLVLQIGFSSPSAFTFHELKLEATITFFDDQKQMLIDTVSQPNGSGDQITLELSLQHLPMSSFHITICSFHTKTSKILSNLCTQTPQIHLICANPLGKRSRTIPVFEERHARRRKLTESITELLLDPRIRPDDNFIGDFLHFDPLDFFSTYSIPFLEYI